MRSNTYAHLLWRGFQKRLLCVQSCYFALPARQAAGKQAGSSLRAERVQLFVQKG